MVFSKFHNVIFNHSSFDDLDLSGISFKGSEFNDCYFSNLRLFETNLSGCTGLLSPIDFLADNFEKTDEGYIAYKVFNSFKDIPDYWSIYEGSVIKETVNPDRTCCCGSGINAATLDWIKQSNYLCGEVWQILIRWEWLAGIIVPYNTDGEFRCEKAELIKKVGNKELGEDNYYEY